MSTISIITTQTISQVSQELLGQNLLHHSQSFLNLNKISELIYPQNPENSQIKSDLIFPKNGKKTENSKIIQKLK